jgi:hypothetical protein
VGLLATGDEKNGGVEAEGQVAGMEAEEKNACFGAAAMNTMNHLLSRAIFSHLSLIPG